MEYGYECNIPGPKIEEIEKISDDNCDISDNGELSAQEIEAVFEQNDADDELEMQLIDKYDSDDEYDNYLLNNRSWLTDSINEDEGE